MELIEPSLRESWRRNGYVVLSKLVDEARLERLRRHAGDVLDGIYTTGRPPFLDSGAWRRSAAATRIVDNPHWADPVIRTVALDRRLGEIAAALLSTSSVRLWATQLLVKPGGASADGNIGWHQDYDYWECAAPGAMATIWLPLDDVSAENGTLSVVCGSHADGHLKLRRFLETDLASQRRLIEQCSSRRRDLQERVLCLQAGQPSLHHCLTLHCSGPNRTSAVRRALSIHVMASGTCYRSGTSCDGHPNVALLRAADGALFDGEQFPVLDGPGLC